MELLFRSTIYASLVAFLSDEAASSIMEEKLRKKNRAEEEEKKALSRNLFARFPTVTIHTEVISPRDGYSIALCCLIAFRLMVASHHASNGTGSPFGMVSTLLLGKKLRICERIYAKITN